VESYALEPEQEYRQMITSRKPTSELRAFLLQHPTFVNIGNEEKETALHIGIWNGDTSFVNFLISLEVDLNQVDRNNHPPLIYACGECDLVMIKLLLENGANTKGILHNALMCTCDPQFHQSDEMISQLDSADGSDSWTLNDSDEDFIRHPFRIWSGSQRA
jgi:ankyrin repeat protein